MRIFFLFKSLLFISVLSLTATFVPAQDSSPAIATLLQIEGGVEVVTDKSPKGRRGRDGMLLYAGNKIRTSGSPKPQLSTEMAPAFVCFKTQNFCWIYLKNKTPAGVLSNIC